MADNSVADRATIIAAGILANPNFPRTVDAKEISRLAVEIGHAMSMGGTIMSGTILRSIT